MRALAAAILAAVAAMSIVALTAVGWPARDYRQGDLFQFYAGGRAILEGADPYDLGWWRAFHEREGSRVMVAPPQPPDRPAWTTPYPLWTLVAFVPLAALPFDVAASTWLVVQIAAAVLGLVLLSQTVLRRRRDRVVLVGLALAFQPLWLMPGNGNITGALFGALVGSLALAGRPLRAGLLLATLALKPQSLGLAALGLIAGAGPRQRSRLVLGAGIAAAVLVVASFAVRPGWIDGWLRSVDALQRSAGSNATLWTLGRTTGVPVLSVLAPLAVLGTLGVWASIRRPDALLLLGASVPVSVAVAPHGWTYDQLHLLVTVAVVIEMLAVASPASRATGLAALAAVAGAVPWALYAIAIRRGDEGWSALVPVLFFVLLIATDRWVLSRDGARPATP